MANTTMMFPNTVMEFMEQHKMVDTEQIYSNGIEYVPIFRMEQWFAHQADTPRWIPVTERLPEEDGRYLITGKRGTVYSLEYEDERWYGGIQPIAWMPLPEPYKGGEEK